MAKRLPRKATKKAPKKAPKKATVDYLTIELEQLATADKDCAHAVRFLCEAILVDIQEPDFKICKFEIGDKKYRARLTLDHCKAILDAVDTGGDVLAVAGGLLGTVTKQAAECIGALMDALHAPTKPPFQAKVVVGCCMYDGVKTGNLTQAQCNQYNPVKWTAGDCPDSKPF